MGGAAAATEPTEPAVGPGYSDFGDPTGALRGLATLEATATSEQPISAACLPQIAGYGALRTGTAGALISVLAVTYQWFRIGASGLLGFNSRLEVSAGCAHKPLADADS